jgi:hypothetical protein
LLQIIKALVAEDVVVLLGRHPTEMRRIFLIVMKCKLVY